MISKCTGRSQLVFFHCYQKHQGQHHKQLTAPPGELDLTEQLYEEDSCLSPAIGISVM